MFDSHGNSYNFIMQKMSGAIKYGIKTHIDKYLHSI